MATIVLVLAVLAAYDQLRPRDDPGRYDGRELRVLRVVDGDTLTVDEPDKDKPETTIRLWGVDTPEVHNVEQPQHFGREASAFTKKVAAGRMVRLELVPGKTRGYFGRLLAYVHLPDGTMLNERLIEEGYAYADPRFPHPLREKFVQLEEEARANERGLWKGVRPEDMPKWRRQRER